MLRLRVLQVSSRTFRGQRRRRPQRGEAGMVVESVEGEAGKGGPEDGMDPERTPVEVSWTLRVRGVKRL